MGNEMVTTEQAEAVLALVKAKFRDYLHTFYRDPVTGWLDWDTQVPVADADQPRVREWQTDNGDKQLAIVWESGSPSEWALCDLGETYTDPEFGFKIKGAGPMPKGVRAEPYYSFVLVLYKEV